MAKISEFTQHDHEVIAREYADLKRLPEKGVPMQLNLIWFRKHLILPMKLIRECEDAPESLIYSIR